MLRILLTLVAANFLVFLWLLGSFDSYLAGGRDPDRISQQVDTDRLKVAPAGRTSNAGASNVASAAVPGNPGRPNPDAPNTVNPDSATATTQVPPASTSGADSQNNGRASPIISNLLACGEFAPLDAAMLARVRTFFTDHAAYFVSEIETLPDTASYLVYSTPTENLAAAQRKFLDFKRQGFEDIAVISEGARQFGMSFGAVRTEALAKALVESLTRRGVRSLRIAAADPDALRSVARFRYQAGGEGLPTDVSKDLEALGAGLGLTATACTPKPAARPAARTATRTASKL